MTIPIEIYFWYISIILDRRDKLFETVEIFSTVKTNFLTVSRSGVSIKTRSRPPGLKKAMPFSEYLKLYCIFILLFKNVWISEFIDLSNFEDLVFTNISKIIFFFQLHWNNKFKKKIKNP